MKRLKTYLPTVLVAGAILYLSLLREPHFLLPQPNIPHLDKVVHFGMYLVLAACLTQALVRTKHQGITLYVTALLSPIIYGGMIELLQEYYFPPRTGDWWDWLADIIGVFIGVILTLRVCRKKSC
ncbi:MAG: VanZ family protein [Paludibacter sp.]|nr:VanZ family protein [Bacteroidales bacterium]MCM1068556.1 VanZ family protein [Prevotella sp.]MCM1353220.1 VanZ family protein [Bacteroides sp.]MCM1442372.1 VanZ family protein [Muribaculum sp.]MCM1481191.1 VanZ family protein [Paludibacter sp.]